MFCVGSLIGTLFALRRPSPMRHVPLATRSRSISHVAPLVARSRTRTFVLLALASLSSARALAQQPPVEQPPIARAPLPNRVNEMLPSWLRLRGEFRERFEGFTGAGFVG